MTERRTYTPGRVRAMLYEYPELQAAYTVTTGGIPDGDPVQGGPGNPVERQAIRLERISHKIRMIERWLAHLSADDMTLVRLRYFHRLPFGTIAKSMQIAASTAWERDQRIIWAIVGRLNDWLSV